MKSVGLAERFAYRHHGDVDRFLEVVMPSISSTLLLGGDLLGHCAVSGSDPFDSKGELSAVLEDLGLENWFPIFLDDLECFRMRRGRWASFDEFLKLSIHVERLMWQLGIFLWLGPDGLQVEILLEPDIALL